MDKQRHHAKRAQKLSWIFGTTSHQVLAKVLEDIESDMAEDADISEEERELFDRAVSRLR